MSTALTAIWRDTLIRFQQTAIRETGRRPITYLRTPMDELLLLPGCQRPGCAFWQPIAWPKDKPPLGKHSKAFHESIIEYLSMCQFLEIRFRLPVASANSPLAFLHGRVFETCKNTQSAPPSRAFEEAAFYQREHPQLPLAYCMAQTCDDGPPLLLMLRAQDGHAFIQHGMGDTPPLDLRLCVDRILPKLQFVYDL